MGAGDGEMWPQEMQIRGIDGADGGEEDVEGSLDDSPGVCSYSGVIYLAFFSHFYSNPEHVTGTFWTASLAAGLLLIR